MGYCFKILKKKPLHALISNLKNDYKIYSSGGLAKSNLNEIREDIDKANVFETCRT